MNENELTTGDFTQENEPYSLFGAWLRDAEASEPNDPNALALATVDADGMPNVRMVLLKSFDHDGFVFFTNYESRKGRELLGQKKAALVFHWKSLRRQVRVRGAIETVSDAEADAYFETRARGSRIGAWASKQSRPLESRFALEKAVAEYTVKFGLGHIPRPAYWSGFRLKPISIEFWHDRPFR
ncbi:MAG: pyridoxamine 5'-phosphate oxidase, partial [Rhizobiaceae bacterium]|nr:pyridoxamine 5'-phosphate oxidase [Rhizobiaceae bacterium]